MKLNLDRLTTFIAMALLAASAIAQTYPVTSPVYQPNAQLAAQSRTTVGTTTPFTVQGVGTVTLRLSGNGANLVGTVQGTNDVVGGSQTWTALTIYPVGGQNLAPSRAFKSTGIYKIGVAGMTQVRVNLTAISSGTLTSRFVGGPIANAQNPEAIDLGALSTFASQAAATVTTSDYTNVLNRGVYCSFYQSGYTGLPSTTYSIQAKDAASGQYISLLTSAAITSANTTPVTLTVFPGAPATSNVSANAQLPATWRISTTVGGTSTPIVSGTVGCQVLP